MEKEMTAMKSLMVEMMGLLKADRMEAAKSSAASKGEKIDKEGPKDKGNGDDDDDDDDDNDVQPQDGAGGVTQADVVKKANVEGEHRDAGVVDEVRKPVGAEAVPAQTDEIVMDEVAPPSAENIPAPTEEEQIKEAVAESVPTAADVAKPSPTPSHATDSFQRAIKAGEFQRTLEQLKAKKGKAAVSKSSQCDPTDAQLVWELKAKAQREEEKQKDIEQGKRSLMTDSTKAYIPPAAEPPKKKTKTTAAKTSSTAEPRLSSVLETAATGITPAEIAIQEEIKKK